MKNNKVLLIILPLLLTVAMMLSSCGKAPRPADTEDPGSTLQPADTRDPRQTSQPANTGEPDISPQSSDTGIPSQTPQTTDPGDLEKILDYRIAGREEGVELLLSNDAYFDGFTQNDLDFRMQKTGASMEEYKLFAKEQVLDFTEGQKAVIIEHMARISRVIRDRGYQLPELEQIVFINTTMKEECGSTAYTHGTQIYIDGKALDRLDRLADREEALKVLDHIFAHELFHCMTRCSKDFRSEMYKIIHFTTRDDDFELPPSVKEYFISNPDVERHNSFATFMINGEPMDCFTAFVTAKHYENDGASFFSLGTTALVPADGTDIYYMPEEAENFDEVFGTNTDYVIDPEECMADNFSYLIAYGMQGKEGNGYSDPGIITSIEAILQNKNQ